MRPSSPLVLVSLLVAAGVRSNTLSSNMVRCLFLPWLYSILVLLTVVVSFAARVSLAHEATRVVQEEYNLADGYRFVTLEMAIFVTTSTFSLQVDLLNIDSPPVAAIQSTLCEMNENVILVDYQYSFQCQGEEENDLSDLSSYVVLLNAPLSSQCNFESGRFFWLTCSFQYRVLHIGGNYASNFLGDTSTTTTTEEALELLKTHWQSVLNFRCYDGTFDTYMHDYEVEQSQDPTTYCSPIGERAFMAKKWAGLEGEEPRDTHGTILCSVLWTTILQWAGLGLPHLVVC